MKYGIFSLFLVLGLLLGQQAGQYPTYPAQSKVLNASPGGNVDTCATYTVAATAAAFKGATTIADVTLATLPARAKVFGVTMKTSQAFAGGGLTTITAAIGNGTTVNRFAPAFDMAQAVAATAFQDTIPPTAQPTTMASSSVVAHFVGDAAFGTGTVTSLTGGSLGVSVCSVVLP